MSKNPTIHQILCRPQSPAESELCQRIDSALRDLTTTETALLLDTAQQGEAQLQFFPERWLRHTESPMSRRLKRAYVLVDILVRYRADHRTAMETLFGAERKIELEALNGRLFEKTATVLRPLGELSSDRPTTHH